MTVEVFESRQARPCQERGLVLKSIGIDHQMLESGGRFHLVVREGDAERALQELVLYEEENRGFGASNAVSYTYSSPRWAIAGYAISLVAGYVASVKWPEMLGAGRGEADSVRAGEWWRSVTALTLHADIGHLAGNLFFGALFLGLLAHVTGSGVALGTVVVAGTLGNIANAWAHEPPHSWIGASTAVFGVLGALMTFQFAQKKYLSDKPRYRWGPIFAGVVLLGYLGMEGPRTDVLAHVTGFACGAILGAALGGRGKPFQPRRRAQLAFGVFASLAVVVSWGVSLA